MSLIQDSLGTLPIVGKLIDPNRAERLLTKWTGNKPLSATEAQKALGHVLHSDGIPSATVSNQYLTIGESFATEIKLPKGVLVSGKPRPKVILESPVLGPIDVVKSGLAKISLARKVEPSANDGKWDTIDVESNAPVPASINLKGLEVPTQYKFPVKIMDQGKIIAKTFIEIGPSRLPKID